MSTTQKPVTATKKTQKKVVEPILHTHHIIPRFEWRILYGNTPDSWWKYNLPNNKVQVTPEVHAALHLARFEKYGHKEDLMSHYFILSNLKHVHELSRQSSLANKGKQFALGSKRTPAQCAARSKAMTGKLRGPYKKQAEYSDSYRTYLRSKVKSA